MYLLMVILEYTSSKTSLGDLPKKIVACDTRKTRLLVSSDGST